MDQAEIDVFVRKGIKLLKQRAVEDAKSSRGSGGDIHHRYYTTSDLMRLLQIPTASYSERSSVLSRLTKRLKEYEERGLVKRGYGTQNNWCYTGPEVDKAVQAVADQCKSVELEAKKALKKLGLRGKKRARLGRYDAPENASYTISHRELLRLAEAR